MIKKYPESQFIPAEQKSLDSEMCILQNIVLLGI